MSEMRITVNGREIPAAEGSTVLEACEAAGIAIPTLCHLKGLMPEGSCRICVVEASTRTGLTTACTESCRNGMTVLTDTPAVREARRFVLDMLLSNHIVNCFSCGKNGGCKLQEYSLEYGIDRTSFMTGRRQPAGMKDDSNPFFTHYPEKCILCTRCVRVCADRQGRNAIGVSGRGFDAGISPGFQLPWSESICESCGNCVANCPTGALSAKDNTRFYRPFEVAKVRTTCPHCAVGCQMDLLVKNNRVVGVEPADGPANHGMLCVKGRFASYKFIHAGDRLKQPLVREGGALRPASWDEALSLVASRIAGVKERHGPDAVAGFSCSRATNEDNFVFQKMLRAAVGTNNVDNCARVCHSASVHGLATTLGSGAMTNPIDDITEDVDAILLIGSNPTEAHPVVGARIRQAVKRGTKLIVVDPRRIDLVDDCELHLQVRPGTNVAFANGMVHVILAEGLEDREFIEARTEGFAELAEIVREYTPERVAEICRIDADDLRRAARLYATAKKAPIIYCLGVTEHSTGTVGVMSLSNLAMAVGKLGKSGCGINPLRGQNNVQGACDMGCLPTDFPGYQKVFREEAREKFAGAWGVSLPEKPGLTSTEVLAGQGDVRALYIFGEDPMVSDPDTAHVRARLEKLDFLVVQDLFLTETAQLADVVLPGVCYAEKEGTFTNTERRVQRVRRAVTPDEGLRQDYEIFCEVMTRLGYPCRYGDAAGIMREIASLTPSFAGISHARLDAGETLQWPCVDATDKGVYFLHKDVFSRGLGYFYPAEYVEARELPDAEYPLLMVTGRMLYHYNAGAMTARTPGIMEIENASYIEMHHDDAARLEVGDGDRVRVVSRRGEIVSTARLGDRVTPGEVFMTFHFPDGNVNRVTNAALDAIARIPEYKVCAVAVERSSLTPVTHGR